MYFKVRARGVLHIPERAMQNIFYRKEEVEVKVKK
jgi:hypothetical protein